jgi:hypothetical protein
MLDSNRTNDGVAANAGELKINLTALAEGGLIFGALGSTRDP